MGAGGEGDNRASSDEIADGITDSMDMSLGELWEMVQSFIFIILFNFHKNLVRYAVQMIYYSRFIVEDGEGNGNPFQYSCLENPVDRGAWWVVVHRVAQSWTRLKQLSMHTCMVEEIKAVRV